jgi:hypothetical protein
MIQGRVAGAIDERRTAPVGGDDVEIGGAALLHKGHFAPLLPNGAHECAHQRGVLLAFPGRHGIAQRLNLKGRRQML